MIMPHEITDHAGIMDSAAPQDAPGRADTQDTGWDTPATAHAPGREEARDKEKGGADLPRVKNLLLDPVDAPDGADHEAGEVERALHDKARKAKVAASYAPEDYAFEFPDGFSPDEALVTAFRDFAADEGIAPDLAGRLAAFQVRMVMTAQTDMAERCEEALRAEWGRDFGRNMREVKSALSYVDAHLPGFKDWVGTLGSWAGGSPEFVRFMHWLGRHVAEDRLMDGGGPAPRSEEMTTLEYITDAFKRAERGDY
jgi:hypothetical protein